MDGQSTNLEGVPGELFARVVHELAVLLGDDLELAAARRSGQARRLLLQIGLGIAAASTLLLAGAAFSSAGAEALRGMLPSWEASTVVGAVWSAAALAIIAFVRPRRLLHGFGAAGAADSVARIERQRIAIERAVSIDAAGLARTAARAVADSALDESVCEMLKLAGTVHDKSDGIVDGLAATLRTPRRLGRGVLGALEHRS
ncbi:MAG TPA: phage holin family protein [Gaiellaceae bacterium]|jgi:hypothetical protein|nr:phage holin family protein [Gaiellaceae bacterium]